MKESEFILKTFNRQVPTILSSLGFDKVEKFHDDNDYSVSSFAFNDQWPQYDIFSDDEYFSISLWEIFSGWETMTIVISFHQVGGEDEIIDAFTAYPAKERKSNYNQEAFARYYLRSIYDILYDTSIESFKIKGSEVDDKEISDTVKSMSSGWYNELKEQFFNGKNKI